MADTRLTHGAWLERVPQLMSECAEEWGRVRDYALGRTQLHKHLETVRWLLGARA